MSLYTKLSMRLFGDITSKILPYLPDLRVDLRRSGMRISAEEFLAQALFITFVVFLAELPLLSLIFAIIFKNFAFSFVFSFTMSMVLAALILSIFLNYPKALIRDKSKEIDRDLPFSTMYLSTVAETRLPLPKMLRVFSRFTKGEIKRQFGIILHDVDFFGLDINTALERAIERSPSKNLREFLWGILSTNLSGGDVNIYLREKARSYMEEFRRKLYEFSHQLSTFIEIYLIAIIMGAIFFTILTAIMAGIAGVSENIIILQFFLIVFFLPMISILFVILIKSITPGGE